MALSGALDLSHLQTVEDVEAFLPEAQTLTIGQANADQTGEYQMTGLAPGTYTLVALTTSLEDGSDVSQWQWLTSIITIEQDDETRVQNFDFR